MKCFNTNVALIAIPLLIATIALGQGGPPASVQQDLIALDKQWG